MTIYYLFFAYWGIAAIVLNQMNIQNGLRLKYNSKVYGLYPICRTHSS
jgi:hypothetical protein